MNQQFSKKPVSSFVPQWVIEQKRDGKELSELQIRQLIRAYTDGSLPDYQMAAFAMSVYFQGMTDEETAVLTDAMMRSGDILDLSSMPNPTADKHSTGGIGDKISLVLAPLAAVAGLDVPMISGRGLGITGGTLDKLESIPGYRVDQSTYEFKSAVATVGCTIIGQTAKLAPADKKLYALRDVTGTVPSIPLITASIMSKKLAEGAQTLVFDVKCGRGAFMQTREKAIALAKSLMRVGKLLGRNVRALVTQMDRPLGRTIGNALEVREAIDVLNGHGPADVRELTIDLVAEMVDAAGLRKNGPELRTELAGYLDDGTAADKFAEMVAVNGGDMRVVDDPDRLPKAKNIVEVAAPRSGFISDVNADTLGRASLLLGAGRRQITDELDLTAGLSDVVQLGMEIKEGEPLAKLHYSGDVDFAEAQRLALSAFAIADEKPADAPIVLETLR